MNKTEHHKKAMLEALESSLGIVTTACKTVGIGRTTHYMWLLEDSDYREAVRDIGEMTIDFAESQLYQQIKNSNTTATIFFLKTKGRDRGYVESQEITINERKPLSWFTDEERERG